MIRNLISRFNVIDDATINLSLYAKTSFTFPRQHTQSAIYTRLYFTSNGNYFYMVSSAPGNVYIHKYQASVPHTIENATYIGSTSVSSTVLSSTISSGIKQFINDNTFIAWNASARKVIKVVMTNDLLPTIAETILGPAIPASSVYNNILVSPDGLAIYLIIGSVYDKYLLTVPFDVTTMSTTYTALSSSNGIYVNSTYCQISYFDNNNLIFNSDLNNDLKIYKLNNKNIESLATLETSNTTLTNKVGVYLTPDKSVIYTVGAGSTSVDISVEKFTKGI